MSLFIRVFAFRCPCFVVLPSDPVASPALGQPFTVDLHLQSRTHIFLEKMEEEAVGTLGNSPNVLIKDCGHHLTN